MISHRNYYSMVGAVDDVLSFIGPDDLILLYLPLAHNFGRCLHLLAGYVGCAIAFCPDPVRPERRPRRSSRPSRRASRACSRRCTRRSWRASTRRRASSGS